MLILSRMINETITITLPDKRVITVMMCGFGKDSRGQADKVRIGIEAPKDVSVHRTEVQRLIDSRKEPGIGEDFG